MLNVIWLCMLSIGFIVGIINNKINAVTESVMSSANTAVTLSMGLLGIICLWGGIMNIAEKSGLIKVISKVAMPVIGFLFPNIPKNHPAIGSIVMNMAANFLGLGNAATPLGIKAMNELQKLNPEKDSATDSMSMFLVLNTSAIQLVPATIIALRSAVGSQHPTDITVSIWIATICSSIAGIIAVKILYFKNVRKRGKKWAC